MAMVKVTVKVMVKVTVMVMGRVRVTVRVTVMGRVYQVILIRKPSLASAFGLPNPKEIHMKNVILVAIKFDGNPPDVGQLQGDLKDMIDYRNMVAKDTKLQAPRVVIADQLVLN